jgi:hypothetical protein
MKKNRKSEMGWYLCFVYYRKKRRIKRREGRERERRGFG